MQDTAAPTALEAAAELRARALAAADERDAALAAQETEHRARALNAAEHDLRRAVRQVIGAEPYFAVVGEIELAGDGYSARVQSGDVTLMVKRIDDYTTPIVTLMAACPDCGEETAYGDYLTNLTMLGVALRASEMPCRECAGGDPWRSSQREQKRAWEIHRLHSVDEAENEANRLEAEGYEVRLYVGDDYVVSGHRYDGF